jgi:hypothetical protein
MVWRGQAQSRRLYLCFESWRRACYIRKCLLTYTISEKIMTQLATTVPFSLERRALPAPIKLALGTALAAAAMLLLLAVL